MNANEPVKWSLDADFLQGCNCDYGCPCQFQAPPTRVFCEGVGAWRIERGSYGDVSLDGLHFGFVLRFPGALHLGNGTVGMLIDERADDRQREALMNISSGKDGGLPFEIFAAITSNALPSQFVPFEFEVNGKRNARVKAGDAFSLSVEPIRNPVTGEEEKMRLEHETGFIFKTGEVVSATVCDADFSGLKFSWPSKAGFLCRVQYHN